MTEKPSFAYCAGAVRHVLNGGEPEAVRLVLEHTIKVLDYMADRSGYFKELARLDHEHPAIAAVLRQAPNARIDGVRLYDEAEADE